MTKLFTFTASRFPKLASANLKDVSTGNAFYLHNGRNAWHSTWVMQYSEGCMHSSERSAKESAEKQRTQGSVFYIRQIPALLLRSEYGCIIVTEINTTRPLAGYSPDAVTKESPTGAALIESARDCYIEKDAPMIGVALSFDFSSRFWSRRPSPRNSVIVVASEDATTTLGVASSTTSIALRSYSNGSNYTLGWTEPKNETKNDPSFITSIAARFSPQP